jgi:hypothetical protein
MSWDSLVSELARCGSGLIQSPDMDFSLPRHARTSSGIHSASDQMRTQSCFLVGKGVENKTTYSPLFPYMPLQLGDLPFYLCITKAL